MGKVVIGMDPHQRSATIEVVADGETVLDVPAKLSARTRVFSTAATQDDLSPPRI